MNEKKWENLAGGYRVPYDPRPALNRLAAGDISAWDELWSELHHQGDVGIASYASVPELVRIHQLGELLDWNTYALIGCIESCRMNAKNPALPDWLKADYEAAWAAVIPLACRDLPRAADETAVRSILGAIALAKKIRVLGDIILNYSGDELSDMIHAYQR